MTYEVRLAALNIARELPHASADELIAAATKIENHLLGTTAAPASIMDNVRKLDELPLASEEEVRAYNAMYSFKPDELTWTGTAGDVKKLMLEGSTLLNVAREIGTTTFLADFVAEQSRNHKQILWMSGTGREAEKARELILKRGGLVAVVDFGGLNRFTEAKAIATDARDTLVRGYNYDFIIVDGLASLPYGKEIDFLATVIPMSKHCIFASTPGREQGLFYDMWTKSDDFQKVSLLWNTPLRPQPEDTAKNMAKLRETIGEDRFRNQFECGFRKIGDSSGDEPVE